MIPRAMAPNKQSRIILPDRKAAREPRNARVTDPTRTDDGKGVPVNLGKAVSKNPDTAGSTNVANTP